MTTTEDHVADIRVALARLDEKSAAMLRGIEAGRARSLQDASSVNARFIDISQRMDVMERKFSDQLVSLEGAAKDTARELKSAAESRASISVKVDRLEADRDAMIWKRLQVWGGTLVLMAAVVSSGGSLKALVGLLPLGK